VAKSLVIVESPAKAKTINKFLGRNYVVKASMGHVRDLPVKTLAVDVKKNFAPKFEVVRGREKILGEIKKAAKTSEAIYLAADPDREGEAICWHLAEELKRLRKPIHRVMFNEITKRAVQEAFAHPGRIDPRKVDAQQARVVEMRYFGGMTVEETAKALEIAPRTVKREWAMAKAWLRVEISSRAGR